MLVIANATIPAGNGNETRKVHILVDGEAIRDILPARGTLPKNGQRIDAEGLLVLPGAIDPHVHFNTPGYTEREDFTCGSMSAAAGGRTPHGHPRPPRCDAQERLAPIKLACAGFFV